MPALYSDEASHANNFDFVRVLLATVVVLCHSYVVYDGIIDRDPLWVLSRHQLSVGTWAVNGFFIISGYLVSQSWNRHPHFLSFLQKRVLRIYPAFVVVCILGILLFGPLGQGWPFSFLDYWFWPETSFRSFVFRLLTLREPGHPPTFMTLPLRNVVNASLWTIPYEFACYLFLAVAAVMRAFAKPSRVLLLFVLAFFLNLLHYHAYSAYGASGVPEAALVPYYPGRYLAQLLNFEHLLLPFAAGMCFYSYRHQIPRSGYGALFSLLVMAIALYTGHGFELAQAVFGTYVLFYFIFQQRVSFKNFSRFGDFSYGIYLYGWPVLQLVLLYAGEYLNVYGLFVCTIFITFFLAALSWHLIEKPFLRFKSLALLRASTQGST